MDITFNCEKCGQQLEIDASASGSELECPTCNSKVIVPKADPSNIHTGNPISSSAAAKEKHHFQVPTSDKPSAVLIEKPSAPLEVAAKDDERKMRIKTIRHSDCKEVGRDNFDAVVSEFLNKVGEKHIISIDHINYTNRDLATGELMTDFGVLVVFRG